MITEKCNMKCAHCGMACTAKGEDMSLETFRKAIEYDSVMVTLGGGEPTIHPLFWQFLMEAKASEWNEGVWLATNGKETKIAIALANLAKKGVISVDLSQDQFHESIDPKVVEAFTKDKKEFSYFDGKENNDYRHIRNTSSHLIKAGRCKVGHEGCICEGLIVKPNGDVKACGCKKAPLFGNVNTEVVVPDNWDTNECYKKQEEYNKIKESLAQVA
jgi:MoaA/NifB/PqqE/SkfB family radical SAM enzyme